MNTVTEGEDKKMFGSLIDEDLISKVKETASTRKESIQTALTNALYLYIDPLEEDSLCQKTFSKNM